MDVPADPLPPSVPPAAPPAKGPGAQWPFAEPTEAEKAAAAATPPPDLREAVIDVLHTIYDPEIPVNIYDLGLVYAVDVGTDQAVTIRMTLTSPACPVAESLPPEVEQKVRCVPGVGSVKVDLVWEPPWGKHLLSEAARLQLGMDGY